MTSDSRQTRSLKEAEADPAGGAWCDGEHAGFVGEQREWYRYYGPTVMVCWDGETFVTVETDPYEGSAIFRIENIHHVIAMLQDIATGYK